MIFSVIVSVSERGVTNTIRVHGIVVSQGFFTANFISVGSAGHGVDTDKQTFHGVGTDRQTFHGVDTDRQTFHGVDKDISWR